MKLAKRFSVGLIISACIVSFPNWLWLVGVVEKPAQDLLEARWAYALSIFVFGLMIYSMSHIDEK